MLILFVVESFVGLWFCNISLFKYLSNTNYKSATIVWYINVAGTLFMSYIILDISRVNKNVDKRSNLKLSLSFPLHLVCNKRHYSSHTDHARKLFQNLLTQIFVDIRIYTYKHLFEKISQNIFKWAPDGFWWLWLVWREVFVYIYNYNILQPSFCSCCKKDGRKRLRDIQADVMQGDLPIIPYN